MEQPICIINETALDNQGRTRGQKKKGRPHPRHGDVKTKEATIPSGSDKPAIMGRSLSGCCCCCIPSLSLHEPIGRRPVPAVARMNQKTSRPESCPSIRTHAHKHTHTQRERERERSITISCWIRIGRHERRGTLRKQKQKNK